MLRSSSMLITRARSVRNAAKLPFRFTFDILVDSVDKIATPGPVVLVWERSQTKVISTKAVTVDRSTRKANFGNEVLSSEITLFKSSPQDKKFQDKVVKLAIKGGNADGKTLGKIHINLAEHAELPSGSKKVSAELNSGSVLIATVQCQFISIGRATPKGNSSKQGSVNDFDESDAEITDVESLVDEGPNSESSPVSVASNNGGSVLKGRLSKLGNLSSKKNSMRRGASARDNNINDALTDVSLGSSGDTNMTTNVGNADKLRKENAKLKRQLEDVEKGYGRDSKLVEENKSLKREIENLKDALKRDPEFHELVAQLKETKMALALLQLERDQLALEVAKNENISPKSV